MSVICREIVIQNTLGLHARPAMQFVDLANQFTCDITVEKLATDDTEAVTVDGKSVMQMITLEATQGTRLQVKADGEDAASAIEQLVKLVDDKFGEDE